jgi:hypothetical protein
LLNDLGGESKGKEPQRAQAYIPHQIPKRKALKSLQEKSQKRAPKITKKEEQEQHRGTMPNHLYIPKRFIQGLACPPIILPSHKIPP